MKQNLFLVALGSLALAACSQVDDVPETNENYAIGFESAVGKNSRAVTGDLDADKFNNFTVYGYYTEEGVSSPALLFKDQVVSKNSEGKWTYSPTRFWVPDATYFFYAYSCADDPLNTEKYGTLAFDYSNQDNTADRALEIQNYVCNSDHQHDLIVAKNEGMKGMEKTASSTIKREVALKFEHALSKINVEFTSSLPGEYEVLISDVKLVNYYDKATFDFGGPNTNTMLGWRDRSKSGNTSIDIATVKDQDVIVPGNAEKAKVSTNSVFMIPMKYDEDDTQNKTATVDLLFTITLKLNDQIYLTRNLKGTWQPNWQRGTGYTYKIDLGGEEAQLEPIVFEMAQDLSDASWGTPQNVTMTFSLQQ